MQPPENAADWYRIKNSAEDADETDIFVYDSIGGWFGLYAEDLIRDLAEISTSRINLRLNSPGGSVFEGIAIANALRAHPAHITVHVDALAASIASVIMLAGDKVIMQPQSQVMIHAASGACYGDATEMTKMADLLDLQTRNIAEAYAEHTGRPVSEFLGYMAAETWFTAKEAVAIGLADEAMPMKPKKEECAPSEARMSAAWDLSMYRYAGREAAPSPIPEPAPKAGEVLTAAQFGAFSLQDILSTEDFANYILEPMRKAIRMELSVIEAAISPSHSTAVEEGTWDAGANEKKLPSPVPLATVKKMYTYYDEDKVEDGAVVKTACKLPHHFVSADGTPGAASVAGVRNALARLPQTQGLSESERSAAEAHLRKHLNAFKGDEEDSLAPPDENVEDAEKKKKLPPFLQPDEDEEEEEECAAHPEEEEECAAEAAETPLETGLGEPDTTVESVETYDSWSSVLARLVKPPSPSADDVLKRLKEAS